MVTAIAIPRSHLLRRIQLAHAGEKNRTVVVTTTAFPYISGRPVDGAINGQGGDGGNGPSPPSPHLSFRVAYSKRRENANELLGWTSRHTVHLYAHSVGCQLRIAGGQAADDAPMLLCGWPFPDSPTCCYIGAHCRLHVGRCVLSPGGRRRPDPRMQHNPCRSPMKKPQVVSRGLCVTNGFLSVVISIVSVTHTDKHATK